MNAKTKMMAIFATVLVILSNCGQKANNATTENNAMLFKTLEGKLLLSIHSHADPEGNGHYRRIPTFFEADLSGDKLVIGEIYKP